MFAKTIIDSDAFLDMPLSAQALYFHLSMRADDDGFVNNPKKIQRMAGAADDDLKLLTAKRFLLPFDTGVVVIKHWRIHNYIQKDRYKPTVYKEEKAMLSIKENGAYTLDTECIQDVSKTDTQVRLGKVSLGKDKDKRANARRAKVERNLDNLRTVKVDDQTILESVLPGLERWVVYKGEKGFSYTPTGLKTLAMMACRNTEQYGAEAVERVIDESIANGYQGVVWDRLSKVKGKAHNFTERADDLDEMAVASMREMLAHGG